MQKKTSVSNHNNYLIQLSVVILPLCSRSWTLRESHYVTDKAETDDLYETEIKYTPEVVENGTSSHHEIPEVMMLQ